MTNVNFIVQVAGSNGLVSVKTFFLSTVTPGNLSRQSYAAGGWVGFPPSAGIGLRATLI